MINTKFLRIRLNAFLKKTSIILQLNTRKEKTKWLICIGVGYLNVSTTLTNKMIIADKLKYYLYDKEFVYIFRRKISIIFIIKYIVNLKL